MGTSFARAIAALLGCGLALAWCEPTGAEDAVPPAVASPAVAEAVASPAVAEAVASPAVAEAVAHPAVAEPAGAQAAAAEARGSEVATAFDAGDSACPAAGDAISVVTRRHELWLCTNGTPWARFDVALGRGGVGKSRYGDRRTPLGTYAAGEPRASALYGTFIPIGYPTPEQVALGFSGSAVGIHGPPRRMNASAHPVTEVDWTLGCIATATDEEVGAIARFVRARQPVVVIR